MSNIRVCGATDGVGGVCYVPIDETRVGHGGYHIFTGGSKKVPLAGGHATSTKVPSFGLIPRQALVAYAKRLELGMQPDRHGSKSYNAQSENFEKVNASKDWVMERLTHVIDHAYSAIEKLMGRKKWDDEDDAGAILFGGGVLACSDHWNKLKDTGYQEAQKEKEYIREVMGMSKGTAAKPGCGELKGDALVGGVGQDKTKREEGICPATFNSSTGKALHCTKDKGHRDGFHWDASGVTWSINEGFKNQEKHGIIYCKATFNGCLGPILRCTKPERHKDRHSDPSGTEWGIIYDNVQKVDNPPQKAPITDRLDARVYESVGVLINRLQSLKTMSGSGYATDSILTHEMEKLDRLMSGGPKVVVTDLDGE